MPQSLQSTTPTSTSSLHHWKTQTKKKKIKTNGWEHLLRSVEWLFVNWSLWFTAGFWIPDLKENLEPCCWAVWLAESGRSSVEMFCRVSSLGESCTPSSTERSVNIYKYRSITQFVYCNVCNSLIYKIIFTSCPVVRSSTRGSIARAGPLDVPVLVQDVFGCLHLTALPGQWVIWWTHQHTRHIKIKPTCLGCVLQH